eukprot:4029599-Pyramimonas_sp.AAC.3
MAVGNPSWVFAAPLAVAIGAYLGDQTTVEPECQVSTADCGTWSSLLQNVRDAAKTFLMRVVAPNGTLIALRNAYVPATSSLVSSSHCADSTVVVAASRRARSRQPSPSRRARYFLWRFLSLLLARDVSERVTKRIHKMAPEAIGPGLGLASRSPLHAMSYLSISQLLRNCAESGVREPNRQLL